MVQEIKLTYEPAPSTDEEITIWLYGLLNSYYNRTITELPAWYLDGLRGEALTDDEHNSIIDIYQRQFQNAKDTEQIYTIFERKIAPFFDKILRVDKDPFVARRFGELCDIIREGHYYIALDCGVFSHRLISYLHELGAISSDECQFSQEMLAVYLADKCPTWKQKSQVEAIIRDKIVPFLAERYCKNVITIIA